MRQAGWRAAITVAVLATAASADPARTAQPLLVIADGAGDLRGCSTAFTSTAQTGRVPVDIEVFPWSHGYREIRKDQVDVAHARRQGEALGKRLAELRAAQPGRQVILVGHSAGSAVILAAAEHLPPGAVERVILLAPSVSSRHDLRPALRAAERGIDVFCSRKDVWALGVAIRFVGTADELRAGDAAGRFGFQPVIERPGDRELYQNLRQHFWSRDDKRLGHDGHHFGTLAPEFLRRQVFPLFVGGSQVHAVYR